MKDLKFTVLMCTYYKDDPYLLKKAIRSIYKNSVKPDFFILTIDGPIPKINKKIINKLSLRYPIKLNILKKNIGLASALNNALKLVKTEWVARADSDDINLSNRFAIQLKFTKYNYDVIGSNILEVDKNKSIPPLTKKIPINNYEIKKFIRSRNPINHMTVLFKTKTIRSAGGYPNIYLREDYALWAKLISNNASFFNIDQILVHVNGGPKLYKRRGGFKNALAEIKLQTFLFKNNIKPLHLSIIHSILRSLILLVPRKLLQNIYIKFLRSS
tara:strand:+ start:2218 stop:3033 length:816 start_codon:yes stop_codon:yes gene_type:complete